MILDTVWRIMWALPLVLAVGMVAVLILRRFLGPAKHMHRKAQRMSLHESLSVSDDTRVHLIEVDGGRYLIVESARQAALQALNGGAGDVARSTAQLRLPWLRPVRGGGLR